jgi:hypothetical protein
MRLTAHKSAGWGFAPEPVEIPLLPKNPRGLLVYLLADSIRFRIDRRIYNDLSGWHNADGKALAPTSLNRVPDGCGTK